MKYGGFRQGSTSYLFSFDFFIEQLVFIIIDFISDMPCGIDTYSSALF